MRHCRFLPVGAWAIVIMLLAAEYPPKAAAGPNLWNGTPVVGHARIAPLDRLQRDFAFLAEGVEEGSTTKIRELFAELSEGIDGSRPAGAVLLFDDTFVPILFVPLKDEARLFSVLASRFGGKFQRQADGLYRSIDPEADIDLVARVVGSWVYVTGFSNRDKLRDVPSDPTMAFEGIDPTLTAHATLHLDQLPVETRDQLLRVLFDLNSASADETTVNSGVALVKFWAFQLLAETKSLQFELQCFRPLEQFHLISRLTAVEGSTLAQWIDDASLRSTLFSHLPSNDSLFAMVSSLKLDAETLRPLLEVWEPLAAKAQAAAPSPRSRNQAEGLLGRLVAQAVDSVTKTLARGELDGWLVVERQGRDRVVLLAGSTLQGARALDEAATDLGTFLQQSPEFRAMGWAVGSNGGVSIHQLTVPVTDESARALFGDPVHLAVGAGNEKLYASMGGEEALTRLSEAVDRSREEAPERGEVFRVSARMAPFLAILDKVPGESSENDRNVHEYAELIAPFKKNDTLELSLKAEDHALEGRFRVDMGVVRMLAAKIPVGSSSGTSQAPSELTGTLQLRAGEDFQLAFNTASEVTKTVAGNERLDRSVYSLTYDFRVVKVDADGTMHIETSLSRAAFEKTAPEGREVFDSKNPPEQDQMTAEMMLYRVAIGETFVVSLRPDGTIAAISGISEAVERVLDTKMSPPADEREQARAFVGQLFNEASLRDSLTRGFEFYPGRTISAGDRWTRTSKNLTTMNFLLDSRYQMKSLAGDAAVISVRSQVREPDPADVADQPMQWEIVGSQSGTITLDPRNGRLRSAEFTLRLDAELTFEMDGNTTSIPIDCVFKMTVGEPQQLAQKAAGNAPAGSNDAANWIELTGDIARSKWQFNRKDAWLAEGNEIVSRGGNYTKWSYCEYADRTFSDFELTAEVLFGPGCNGGICLRATSGGLDGVNPSGYEVQLLGIETNRNPTGSIYKMPAKGPVSGAYSARPGLVQPNEWFSVRVVAQGTTLTVYISDEKVASFDDLSEPIRSGHVILQGSPEGVIRYKNIRVRPL